jgi:hypothetical protein
MRRVGSSPSCHAFGPGTARRSERADTGPVLYVTCRVCAGPNSCRVLGRPASPIRLDIYSYSYALMNWISFQVTRT